MSFFASFRAVTLAMLAALLTGFTSPAIAHPSSVTENAEQNRALLSAVVALGGGSDHFNATTFRKALETKDEEQRLSRAVGAEAIKRFDKVFSFVVMDGLSIMKREGAILPAADPDSKDTKAIAAALYRAGLQDGVFQIERLFDVLFSPRIHLHAMTAVARMYGEAGETAFHLVLGKLVTNEGSPVRFTPALPGYKSSK